MKGFFILILLSACGQTANSTPYKEDQKSKILTEGTNTTLSSPSDSIEMSAEPSKDSEDNLGDYLFMTEDEVASYMSGIHGADFKVFFETQLVSYGTNIDGRRKIDIKQFQKAINLIIYNDTNN